VLPNGSAPDKSGCGADNFQIAENEMAPHKILFRAVAFNAICDMALCATSSCYKPN
jgi:hypothetical protein